MRESKIIPYIIKSNIEMIEYILEHPKEWGSGTKEDWEKKLEEQKQLLRKGMEAKSE